MEMKSTETNRFAGIYSLTFVIGKLCHNMKYVAASSTTTSGSYRNAVDHLEGGSEQQNPWREAL